MVTKTFIVMKTQKKFQEIPPLIYVKTWANVIFWGPLSLVHKMAVPDGCPWSIKPSLNLQSLFVSFVSCPNNLSQINGTQRSLSVFHLFTRSNQAWTPVFIRLQLSCFSSHLQLTEPSVFSLCFRIWLPFPIFIKHRHRAVHCFRPNHTVCLPTSMNTI